MIKIIRKSPFSGDTNVMTLDVSEAQLEDWQSGTLIQDAMPDLSADEREFIMTGITPTEWAATFGH
jgi:hypothetical protein